MLMFDGIFRLRAICPWNPDTGGGGADESVKTTFKGKDRVKIKIYKKNKNKKKQQQQDKRLTILCFWKDENSWHLE